VQANSAGADLIERGQEPEIPQLLSHLIIRFPLYATGSANTRHDRASQNL